MIGALYHEHEVAEHPLTLRLRRRFRDRPQIAIDRYGEVFNRAAQNFRLQKRRPSLILARKHGKLVLPTPVGYGIGADRNVYMAHMLNCVYDCRYCFLQGMYRSAHYVLFVNYDDFRQGMAEELDRATPGEITCFFSGYDCDSLALEPVSGYVADLLPFFDQYPNAWLELRTKSTQIRSLLAREPLANVIVAFSLTPNAIADALEHKTPSVERRIEALAALAEHGWPVGLRFDPLIDVADFERHYRELFAAVFARIDPRAVHSVTLGPFRLPREFHQRIQRLYPDEPLFALSLEERAGLVSYPSERERIMHDFCREELRRYLPDDRLFSCDLR